MEDLLKQFGLSASTLISVSRFDSARVVHLIDNRVYKIVDTSRDTVQNTRINTVGQEAKILGRLSQKTATPQNVKFGSLGTCEYLEYDYIDGKSVEHTRTKGVQKIVLILRLVCILFRLSASGIAHRDINVSNVICGVDGKLTLIDFDQAIEASILTAFAENFLGNSSSLPRGHGSFWTFARNLFERESQIKKSKRPKSMKKLKSSLRFFIPNAVINRYRKAVLNRQINIRRKKWEASLEIPNVPEDCSERLHLIREAWLEAKISRSNTPGFDIAYYALTIDGYQFPGERPWAERWAYLSEALDFEGKRILELGCNLGLLSTFALKEANAKAAFCVDGDYRILSAAQKVAAAFQVEPAFKRINFDSNIAWEDELTRFCPDVVFALNVLNWVKNKDRFLAFLSQFDSIVYEGHDSFEIEKARFSSLGFRKVEIIAVSEREREVLKISR